MNRLFLALLLLPATASAATIVVDDDGLADYTSIQDALDAAEPGDTIVVFDGTYVEGSTFQSGPTAAQQHEALLHLTVPVTLVGRSPGAVVVTSPERTEAVTRSSAIHVGDVDWDQPAAVRNLTFLHSPGPVTGLQAPRAFVTVGNVPGGPSGDLLVQNVVYVHDGPEKTWVRHLQAHFGLVLDHVTFTSRGVPAGLSFPGQSPPDDAITNSILDTLWAGYTGPPAGAEIAHSLVNGPQTFDGERIVTDRPRFVDGGALDLRLLPDTPGVNAADPDVDCLDADGTLADLGAYGGDGAGCPGPQFPVDADGDGYGPEPIGLRGVDCDDEDPRANPGAEEVCDGVDTDCDGELLGVEQTDLDGDGAPACIDCDDDDADRSPFSEEICDGVDNDCDGAVLDGGEEDGDGDTFRACEECDDTDADVHPDALEVCDGVDNDCDTATAEGTGEPTDYYLDADGDGYGVEASPYPANPACAPPDGYAAVVRSGEDTVWDCDDGDAAEHPGGAEVCDDGADNNCDDLVDFDDIDCHEAGCAVVAPPRSGARLALLLLALGLAVRASSRR